MTSTSGGVCQEDRVAECARGAVLEDGHSQARNHDACKVLYWGYIRTVWIRIFITVPLLSFHYLLSILTKAWLLFWSKLPVLSRNHRKAANQL